MGMGCQKNVELVVRTAGLKSLVMMIMFRGINSLDSFSRNPKWLVLDTCLILTFVKKNDPKHAAISSVTPYVKRVSAMNRSTCVDVRLNSPGPSCPTEPTHHRFSKVATLRLLISCLR